MPASGVQLSQQPHQTGTADASGISFSISFSSFVRGELVARHGEGGVEETSLDLAEILLNCAL